MPPGTGDAVVSPCHSFSATPDRPEPDHADEGAAGIDDPPVGGELPVGAGVGDGHTRFGGQPGAVGLGIDKKVHNRFCILRSIKGQECVGIGNSWDMCARRPPEQSNGTDNFAFSCINLPQMVSIVVTGQQ